MEAEHIQGLEERMGLLSGAFVNQVAALYDETNDALVLADDFRRPFLDRGYLTLDELAKIAAWKTQRQKIHVLRNVSETVEAVTRQAFNCPEPWLAAWTLSYLTAVNTRLASAILTVFDPTRYAVFDIRTWSALKRLDVLEPLGLSKYGGIASVNLDSPETYAAYLEACRRLADEADVSLRALDRCLWTVGGLGASELAAHGIVMPSEVTSAFSQP
ncbi:MAG TPA: hypothetical protein VFH48_16195 [Chloroflexota bacterium]|nr:hypothetical protein [Chloroflexota bacterium]